MSLIVNFAKSQGLRGLRCNFTQWPKAMCTSKTPAYLQYEKDPQPMFTDAETQQLLKSMTQLDLNKVFRKTTVKDNSMENKFMTTEQLEEEFKKALQKARVRLQMPPVVQMADYNLHKVISKDPALTSFSDTKYVFTDITYGLRETERKVVVRDIDGTLEHAPLALAKRMKQLYFPLTGRKIETPLMFADDANFQRCLDEHKYEFVLNRMTVQFDPYEREFHELTARVYLHLNESKQFDVLRSTRHFGPMAFFYAWHRCIDDLLCDMIRRDYLNNAVELIALMYKLHGIESEASKLVQQVKIIRGVVENDDELAVIELQKALNESRSTTSKDIQTEIQAAIGKTREDFDADELCLAFINKYITSAHCLKKVQLELVMQTLMEINEEKRQLFDGLNKAHGVL